MHWNWTRLAIFCLSLIAFAVLPAQSADITSKPFKCSACRAIADILAEKLTGEKPRNHLDVRHRLDKDGNRYGKVIEYTVSEIRAIEILEHLCSKDELKHYTLFKPNPEIFKSEEDSSNNEYWGLRGTGNLRDGVSKNQLDQEQKMLGNFCNGFIEQKEDDIIERLIRGSNLDLDEFSSLLCTEIGKHCTDKPGEDPWLYPLLDNSEDDGGDDASDDDSNVDVQRVEL